MNSNTTAIQGNVPFGKIEIEGYLLPESLWTKTNKYGLSKTQAVLFAYPQHDRSQASVKYLQIVSSQTSQNIKPNGFTVYSKVVVEGRTERVDLVPLNEIPIFLEICRVLKRKGKSSRFIEKKYKNKLCKELLGKTEIPTLAGNIDILTSIEIIEVKPIKLWKDALGQILSYGHFYPSHQKRLHLFGETQDSYLTMIRDIVSKYGVVVTWEP